MFFFQFFLIEKILKLYFSIIFQFFLRKNSEIILQSSAIILEPKIITDIIELNTNLHNQQKFMEISTRIAEKLGTKAYRAVGTALNKNPNAPTVPCHRVINSDGGLCGYSKGLKEKIKLLKKENINIKNNKIVNLKKVLFDFKK